MAGKCDFLAGPFIKHSLAQKEDTGLAGRIFRSPVFYFFLMNGG